MVGKRSFLYGMVYFQGPAVKLAGSKPYVKWKRLPFLWKCFNQIHNEKALNSHSFATSLGDSWCNPHNTEDIHLWELIGNPRNFGWMSITLGFSFEKRCWVEAEKKRSRQFFPQFPSTGRVHRSGRPKKNSLQVGRWNDKKRTFLFSYLTIKAQLVTCLLG